MGNSSSGGAVAILRSLFDIALNLQKPLALACLGYHQQIFCAHHFQKNILRNSLSKKPFESQKRHLVTETSQFYVALQSEGVPFRVLAERKKYGETHAP